MRQRIGGVQTEGVYLLTLVLAITFIVVCSRSARAIRPEKHYNTNPATEGMLYDSLNITTSYGARLSAWLCKPTKIKSRAIVVVAGPDAGNMADQLSVSKLITDALGVSVLLFDYEGFGQSDSMLIDPDLIADVRFSYDIKSVVEFAIDSLTLDSSLVLLYGRSMGASLCLGIATDFPTLGGLICESPYASQAGLIKGYEARHAEDSVKRKLHFLRDFVLEPLSNAPLIHCPSLLLSGQLDTTPFAEIADLYSKLGSRNKHLWIAAKSKHLEIPYLYPGLFLSYVYSFIKDSAQK